jgi:hypothetical protein
MKLSAALSTGLLSILIPLFARGQSAPSAASAPASTSSVPAEFSSKTVYKVETPACKTGSGDCITVALDAVSIIGTTTVPAGVTYKKTMQDDNIAASSLLFAMLANTQDEALEEIVSGVLICGPGLWLEMNGTLEGNLHGTSRSVHVFPGTPTRRGEGRGLITPEDRKVFLQALRKRYAGKLVWVRRPSATALVYYWNTIPYDIEEPIFTAETDGHVLIAHFRKDVKGIHLFLLDEVVDFNRFATSSGSTAETAKEIVLDIAKGKQVSGKSTSAPAANPTTAQPAASAP